MNEPLQKVFIYVFVCLKARDAQTPTCYQGYQKIHEKKIKKINELMFIEAAQLKLFFNAYVWQLLPCSDVYKRNAQPIRTCKGINILWV